MLLCKQCCCRKKQNKSSPKKKIHFSRRESEKYSDKMFDLPKKDSSKYFRRPTQEFNPQQSFSHPMSRSPTIRKKDPLERLNLSEKKEEVSSTKRGQKASQVDLNKTDSSIVNLVVAPATRGPTPDKLGGTLQKKSTATSILPEKLGGTLQKKKTTPLIPPEKMENHLNQYHSLVKGGPTAYKETKEKP